MSDAIKIDTCIHCANPVGTQLAVDHNPFAGISVFDMRLAAKDREGRPICADPRACYLTRYPNPVPYRNHGRLDAWGEGSVYEVPRCTDVNEQDRYDWVSAARW